MFFLCRATNWFAGVAGTAQFPRVSVEVEGSLQNPQKVKRTVQVPWCIFTVTITEGWLDLLAEPTRSFNLFVLVPGSEEMQPTF